MNFIANYKFSFSFLFFLFCRSCKTSLRCQEIFAFDIKGITEPKFRISTGLDGWARRWENAGLSQTAAPPLFKWDTPYKRIQPTVNAPSEFVTSLSESSRRHVRRFYRVSRNIEIWYKDVSNSNVFLNKYAHTYVHAIPNKYICTCVCKNVQNFKNIYQTVKNLKNIET